MEEGMGMDWHRNSSLIDAVERTWGRWCERPWTPIPTLEGKWAMSCLGQNMTDSPVRGEWGVQVHPAHLHLCGGWNSRAGVNGGC